MTPPDALAVVVVTHDSAAHLPELLGALLEQLDPDDELVVVDNASSDDSVAAAQTRVHAFECWRPGRISDLGPDAMRELVRPAPPCSCF